MKLWLLLPKKEFKNFGDTKSPWPFYDSCHGMLIRAETEADARRMAVTPQPDNQIPDGKKHYGDEGDAVWLSNEFSDCTDVSGDGPAGIIMSDFNAG